MRIRKSILKKKGCGSPKKPAPDMMDPTTNLNLHIEIWTRLMEKIAAQFQKRYPGRMPANIIANPFLGMNPSSSTPGVLWISTSQLLNRQMNGDSGAMSDGC
jgi:hypothetical protein